MATRLGRDCPPEGKWERPRGSLLGPSGLSLRTGDRLCVRGDGEQGPGSHHLSFPGRGPAGLWSHSAWGWAPANRQQQRLLGGFSFKQKRTLSGNMCLFSPSASLPPFPSPFCFQIFLFFGASLSVCFPLSCSICLSVSLLTVSPSPSGLHLFLSSFQQSGAVPYSSLACGPGPWQSALLADDISSRCHGPRQQFCPREGCLFPPGHRMSEQLRLQDPMPPPSCLPPSKPQLPPDSPLLGFFLYQASRNNSVA